MGTHFSIPKLKTLATNPSWHNRAGRIDRSACFVLTASQLWRCIPEDDWTDRYPARQSASVAKGKCDRWAERRLWARDLWELHKWEPPYPLRGDFRTAKSNAMRGEVRGSRRRGEASQHRAQMVRQDSILGDGPVNPNRGVGFSHCKLLGLNAMWSTTLRIERIVQHAKLRQHFLVCPVCSEAVEQRLGGQSSSNIASRRCSTASKKLPGRVTKLYLPLCTPREWEDALLAQLWLNARPQHVTHPNRPLAPEVLQLIERYGELFEPRRLRCRHCLGLRYGEVKPRDVGG